jgi:hypothetical protein
LHHHNLSNNLRKFRNTTVLIAAKTKTVIPVSCVERSRWDYRTKQFGSSGTRSSSKLLYALKMSVSRSLKEKQGHRSDQGQVWAEVDRLQDSLGTNSTTDALADTYEAFRHKISDAQEKVRYVDGATGVAVAIGNKVVALDVFDKPSTCQKAWGRMLSGVVLDALESEPSDSQANVNEVQEAVAALRTLPWEQVEPVGQGEEYRGEGEGLVASSLVYQDVPVHVAAVAEWSAD